MSSKEEQESIRELPPDLIEIASDTLPTFDPENNIPYSIRCRDGDFKVTICPSTISRLSISSSEKICLGREMLPNRVYVKTIYGSHQFFFVSRERADAAYNKLLELWRATRVSSSKKE